MPATLTEAPTELVSFRATPAQLAKLQAEIPAYRRATGRDLTVSGLVRHCIDAYLSELSEVK